MVDKPSPRPRPASAGDTPAPAGPDFAGPPPGTEPPSYPPPGYPPPGYPPPGYPPPGYAGPGYPAPGYATPGVQLPPGYEIKRKKRFYKRVWFWLLVIILVIIIAVVAAISKAAKDATSKPHTVVYRVTGTGNIAKADISYYTSDGSNKSSNVSVDGRTLPWTKTITVKGDLSGFILTANTPFTGKKAKGTLSCTLTVDGKVASTDKSRGSASLVTCAGSGYDGS